MSISPQTLMIVLVVFQKRRIKVSEMVFSAKLRDGCQHGHRGAGFLGEMLILFRPTR